MHIFPSFKYKGISYTNAVFQWARWCTPVLAHIPVGSNHFKYGSKSAVFSLPFPALVYTGVHQGGQRLVAKHIPMQLHKLRDLSV